MYYHDITHDDMKNGDGLRIVLWVAGCEHHCPHCQNQITWNPEGGIPFDFKEVQEILHELKKDYISGITFSGGDPLHPLNRDTIYELLKLIRRHYADKTVWIYTGYTWEEVIWNPETYKLMQYVDVLVDGRYMEELKDNTYPWAGSTNQRVIDVQKSLEKGEVVLHGSH